MITESSNTISTVENKINNYQQCIRCIMDTSDSAITFDQKGVCSHCNNFDNVVTKKWFPNKEGEQKFNSIIDKIKENGKGKEYDCIIGLSGGLDSSYLAYVASQAKLRILAVHVDAGWNSELAVQNIENIVKKCGIDLYTHVVDWEVMKDLHFAFFKAQVPNQDIPQDHAFFAALYGFATKHNIEYVLHGSNFASESVLPQAWGYNAMDSKHIKSIHKKYGRISLKNYPLVSFLKLHIFYPYLKRMKVAKLLNYIPYKIEDAIKLLEEKVDYQYYGGKHYESRFTKFFQTYYLPTKFGFDKRKAHLSGLILSGQKTREEALEFIKKPSYDLATFEDDKEYFIKKLGISNEEYNSLMASPPRAHSEFVSNRWLFELYAKTVKKFKHLVPAWLKTTV